MCDQQSLRSACPYAQSDQSLCWSLDYSMSVKLLPEHHLEFLSLKGGCTGSSESTLVKIPHCWKSHVVAQMSSKIKTEIYKNIREKGWHVSYICLTLSIVCVSLWIMSAIICLTPSNTLSTLAKPANRKRNYLFICIVTLRI